MRTRKDLIMGLWVGLLLALVLSVLHNLTEGFVGGVALGCLAGDWGDKLWANYIKPWLARRRNEND